MLVLSRKRSQRIRLGKDIWIEVLHTGRSTVKLGLTAPQGFAILREELIGRPHFPTTGESFDSTLELPENVL